MPAFQREQTRFTCKGVKLTSAADNCPPGKFPLLFNVRSTVDGVIQSRPGFELIAGAASGFPIHSLARFDDPTSFATYPQLYAVGADQYLRVWERLPSGAASTLVINDSGYSGDPLAMVAVNPPNSPQPWLYIGDSAKMRRYRSATGAAATQQIGIAAPTTAPGVALDRLGLNLIEGFGGFFIPWTTINAQIAVVGGVTRVNTPIASVIYDSGNTGYASIVPTAMTGISEGMVLTIAGVDNVVVTKLTIAVVATTIAAIIYDAGNTGMCTIQPAASLGVGQLDSPTVADYERRWLLQNPAAANVLGERIARGPLAGTMPTPTGADPSLSRIRQVDFPVDCVINLPGEQVRVQSIALGPDGVQSFRCSTTLTQVVGNAITGSAGFRAYLPTNRVAGDTLVDNAFSYLITPVSAGVGLPYEATTGIRTGGGGYNLSTINGRATLDQDDIRLSIRFSDCTNVQTVRVYFDVDPTTNDFTRNYFFHEWRSNDILAAIQATNGAPVDTLQDVRGTTIARGTLNAPPLPLFVQQRLGRFDARSVGPVTSTTALSAQLALGNNQWIDLHCKVKDLVHIGTDTSRTLANVAAAEIVVNIYNATLAGPVTTTFDGLSITGGYGPDTGSLGNPYVYRYRYRNTETGAHSGWSPPTRGSVAPQRQRVILTGAVPPDSQTNVIDWARFGGGLADWTVVGTQPYSAGTPTFNDDYADNDIDGSERINLLEMQPWPTQDLPRTGTCNIAGNAISRVSGDTFNTSWAPGSVIILNGQAYTLYAQPSSASLLFINENAGIGTGVAFRLPGPTILSQPARTLWGGTIQSQTFLFTIDPIDPGRLRWTQPNNPEASTEANNLEVTSAAEPLQNGFIWDGYPFVASSDQLYAIDPTYGDAISSFRSHVTPCDKGFWTPWAFAPAPEGVYFLAKDGIYLTVGGSAAQSITDADLYPLFPHEGVNGIVSGGTGFVNYASVDMTQTNRLRLSYCDGWLYFDYIDVEGYARSLCYHVATQSWWPDFTKGLGGGGGVDTGVTMRGTGVGDAVHQLIIGASDGQIYQPGGDLDWQTECLCVVQHVVNQQDARRQKIYRDLMLDAALDGAINVYYGVDNVLTTTVALTGGASRSQIVIPIVEQQGLFGTNLFLQYTWNTTTAQPLLYVFDVAFQPAPELTNSWLSGPTTHTAAQFQQVCRALIAYRSFSSVTLSVIIDGTTYTYDLPSTAGQYLKREVMLRAVKGMAFQWGLQTNPYNGPGFQVFDQDCAFMVQPWGVGGGYQLAKPF